MNSDTEARCDVFYFDAEKAERLAGKDRDVAGMAEIFKALSDETRTKILYLLSLEELCVCDISNLLSVSVSAVSHHLRLLRVLRLVRSRREGKMVYYSLADHHISHIISDMKDHLSEEGSVASP